VIEDVIRRRLGVVRRDLPVSIAVENACVEKLEFRVVSCAARAPFPKTRKGKHGLRIVIALLQPGGGWRRVEVPPLFLGVLAVIASGAGEPENSLLKDRVATVPKRERKTKALLAVA
jgi:hypothetical protein